MTLAELLESVRRVEVRTNRIVNDMMVGQLFQEMLRSRYEVGPGALRLNETFNRNSGAPFTPGRRHLAPPEAT